MNPIARRESTRRPLSRATRRARPPVSASTSKGCGPARSTPACRRWTGRLRATRRRSHAAFRTRRSCRFSPRCIDSALANANAPDPASSPTSHRVPTSWTTRPAYEHSMPSAFRSRCTGRRARCSTRSRRPVSRSCVISRTHRRRSRIVPRLPARFGPTPTSGRRRPRS